MGTTLVQIDEQLQTETTIKFTEQQIQDHIEKVENLCLICRSEGALMFESVQIIRQLQEEVAEYAIYGKLPELGETINNRTKEAIQQIKALRSR